MHKLTFYITILNINFIILGSRGQAGLKGSIGQTGLQGTNGPIGNKGKTGQGSNIIKILKN